MSDVTNSSYYASSEHWEDGQMFRIDSGNVSRWHLFGDNVDITVNWQQCMRWGSIVL